MQNPVVVQEVLRRILSSPKRDPDERILETPFEELAEEIFSADTIGVLRSYARRTSTLRDVLSNPKLQLWLAASSGTRLFANLQTSLQALERVLAEESEAFGDPMPAVPTPGAFDPAALRTWAEERGILERLADPASVVSRRLTSRDVERFLRRATRSTVFELATGTASGELAQLHSTVRQQLAAAARAYLEEVASRVLKERREDERVAALGFEPQSEGVRAFVRELDAACARVGTQGSGGVVPERVVLLPEADRLEIHAFTRPDRDGRERTTNLSLDLRDWRGAALETRVGAPKAWQKGGVVDFVLRLARRIVHDPASPVHAALTSYLDQPGWRRALEHVDKAIQLSTRQRLTGPLDWVVGRAKDGHVELRGMHVGETGRPDQDWQRDPARNIALGLIFSTLALDEIVARACFDGSPPYYQSSYSSTSIITDRERVFHALTLLVGHDRVRTTSGAPLRVVSVELETSLTSVDDGFRLAFTIGDESITAADVREALDDHGRFVLLDPVGARVVLARVSRPRAALLRALCRESVTFPASARDVLLDRLVRIEPSLPIALPAELAGDPVPADPRPLVRVHRPAPHVIAVECLVRPLAGGPVCAPGEGRTQMMDHVGGRAVFTTRDKRDERARADALRARLPGGATRFEGTPAMLDAIEVLRAAAESNEATIEWPKSLPRVVGRPAWQDLKLRVTAQRDWFALRGEVEVDGIAVSLADLLAARRHGDRFVAIGADRLVELREELSSSLAELDDMLRTVSAGKDGRMLAGAAIPGFLDLVASRDQIDAAHPFWSLLERIDDAAKTNPRAPRGFAKILRSYQLDGFRWMTRLAAWGAGACLADEMGLGKTVQTLALLAARSALGPALVVAPTSVGPNWVEEANRFAPSLRTVLRRGTARAESFADARAGDVIVTSYDTLARDESLLATTKFATLVLDEAQAVKNVATSRSRAARAVRADFRLALTGTPVENRLADLYSIMELLNPGLFGTEAEFRERFVIPIERDHDEAASRALSRLVRPFLLRRKKAEVLAELPARTEITRTIERGPEERKLYEAARRLALAAIAGQDESGRFNVLAELMRLRRLACHPKLDDARSTVPSAKLEALLELVTELREAGHRALVFSQFTGHLDLVRGALRERKIAHLYLDGKTPVPERARLVAAFQAGEGDLFLISLRAGGTGLNLTAADTVIHLDPWWNPAVEDQATDRAHRIGQARPVTVIRLVAGGTIEEAVMSLHRDKRQLAESILDGSATSGKLSIAELGALIRDGARSVAPP